MNKYSITFQDIVDAYRRIEGQVHFTPVMTCSTINQMAGRSLFFKCEQWQKVGAFKFRGACNAIAKLSDEAACRGVVTHSSGNHAQALALAAKMRNIPAHVVMPSNAPQVKRKAVEGYGAHVVLCEPNLQARESTAAEIVRETGATFIPPYDHVDVIAGQGTVALEFLREIQFLDAMIAPVGGGGLISGTALTVKSMAPYMKVFAAEPAGADDAYRSKKANELIPQTNPKTIADGLLTSLGSLTWPVIRDVVKEVITVSDEEIIFAMRTLWERAKLLVEPSAAVPLAAILSKQFREMPGMERVGIILSGGNVDLERLPW